LRANQSKIVLKEAMRGLLPEETLNRRKQGFTPPDQTWYKESMTYIRDLILSPQAIERGYFQPSYIQKILDDHLTDKRNNRFLIWSLMSFEWWNRLFVDREPLPGT
jgi:asparagine synthase (glutamine-hydrolysing)